MIETTNHVLSQSSDYVLGLLSVAERHHVEDHLASCRECRQAIQRESALVASVRATLEIATRPDRDRIRRLMPSPPTQRRAPWVFALRRQVALSGLLLLLLLGSWGLWRLDQQQIWMEPTPTSLAATATVTEAPTATLVDAFASPQPRAGLSVATVPARFVTSVTPVPNPTPVAFAQPVLFNN